MSVLLFNTSTKYWYKICNPSGDRCCSVRKIPKIINTSKYVSLYTALGTPPAYIRRTTTCSMDKSVCFACKASPTPLQMLLPQAHTTLSLPDCAYSVSGCETDLILFLSGLHVNGFCIFVELISALQCARRGGDGCYEPFIARRTTRGQWLSIVADFNPRNSRQQGVASWSTDRMITISNTQAMRWCAFRDTVATIKCTS